MTDEQNALFAKARRALQTARINLDEDDPEAASNRAYYAAYYAATAALLEVGETPKTHSGTHRRFHLHYVASGLLPKHLGHNLDHAFDFRLRADYETYAIFDKMAVSNLIADVTKLVDAVESLLEGHNGTG